MVRWATTAQYPSVIMPTQPVHAMARSLHRYRTPTITLVQAWRRAAGATLIPGIPTTGEAPWDLFTTDDYGTRWHLAHVSRLSPASRRRRTGFPATRPSQALIALALTSPRRIWIAQTINCMAGPENQRRKHHPSGKRQWWTILVARDQSHPRTLRVISDGPRARYSAQADQPTVHLAERNVAGALLTRSWAPLPGEGR